MQRTMHFVPHGRLEAALLIVSVSSENKTGSAAYYSLECDNHIKSDSLPKICIKRCCHL